MQSEKIKAIYVEDGAITTSTTMIGDFKQCTWSEIAGSLIKRLWGYKIGLCAAFLLSYKWHYPKRRHITRVCMCVWWDCLTVKMALPAHQLELTGASLLFRWQGMGWNFNFLNTGFWNEGLSRPNLSLISRFWLKIKWKNQETRFLALTFGFHMHVHVHSNTHTWECIHTFQHAYTWIHIPHTQGKQIILKNKEITEHGSVCLLS